MAATDEYIDADWCGIDMGKMTHSCKDCGALHFTWERLVASTQKSPKFGSCCKTGAIDL